MRSFPVLLQLFFCSEMTKASILTGFSSKETPSSLADIPNIAEQVRRHTQSRSQPMPPKRVLKGKSSKKGGNSQGASQAEASSSVSSSNADEAEDDGSVTGRNQGANVDRQFPYIPEAQPEFNEDGEFSFVILMDEFGYNTNPIALGTTFAFSGRLATDEYLVGRSTGTCTIGSDRNTNFAICTFYLTFNSEGYAGKGTIALTGNTDDVGGYMQVTGTGQDLFLKSQGNAHLVFDPAGNPIIYILVSLQ